MHLNFNKTGDKTPCSWNTLNLHGIMPALELALWFAKWMHVQQRKKKRLGLAIHLALLGNNMQIYFHTIKNSIPNR